MWRHARRREGWRGEALTLRADTNQCAQITYDINGDPDSMTIRGGIGTNTIPILNPGRRRDLHVNNCDVCADEEQQVEPQLPDCVRTARGCPGTKGALGLVQSPVSDDSPLWRS